MVTTRKPKSKPGPKRSAEKKQKLADYYLSISPELEAARAKIGQELAALPKPKMVYAGASDFPVINKSFNFSYSGTDR